METRVDLIDVRQLGTLLAVNVVGTTFIMLPSVVSRHALNASWISVLIGSLGGMAMAVILLKLATRFPDQTVTEYAPKILGPFFGGALGLCFTLVIGYLSSVLLRQFAEVFTTVIMPNTPISVFMLILTALVIYANYGGLTTIARLAQLWFPIVVLSLVVLFAAAGNEMQLARLKPPAGPGIGPILDGSWIAWVVFGQGLILLWLFPFLRRQADGLKAIWWGKAVATLMLVGVTAGTVAILGALSTIHQTFPLLTVTRLVSIGGFIERLELIFIITWFVAAFLKISITFWAFSLGFAQILNVPSRKPLILPLAALTYMVGLVPENIIEVSSLSGGTTSRYEGWVFYVGPLLLLMVAALRGKGVSPSVRS